MHYEPRIIVLSGPVCAGKSTLARNLAATRTAKVLTTRRLLAEHLGAAPNAVERRRLQEIGDELDAQVGGEWIASGLRELVDRWAALVVVDAVRKQRQLKALAELGPTLHVHLTASEDDLSERYEARRHAQPELEFPTLEALRNNSTEADVERLAASADLVVDTSEADPQQTCRAVLDLLGEEGQGWG